MRLGYSTTLPNGLRIRLRLSRPSDRPLLRALCTRLGLEADDLWLGRLVRFAPQDRTAMCATVFAGGREAVVGYGAIERFDEDPDVLLADEDAAPGVRALLSAALCHHAARHVA
jgi:hypothetical protein